MSLAFLVKLSKSVGKPTDPKGREYRTKKIVGASKGHWRVEYCYSEEYGHSYIYFWERRTDKEMEASNCYAEDYNG